MKERVAIALKLSVGGNDHEISGGNVRAFSVQLTSWGVEGWVEFVVQDDKKKRGKYDDTLLADFVKPDLGEIALSLEPAHLETPTRAADAAIQVAGILLQKSVEEEVYSPTASKPSVLVRRYRVTFADAACALWGQHFPCALYTKKSFQDVIEAHKGNKIILDYDWELISTQVPLISFHLSPGGGASFYDLVIGYVRDCNGAFTLDHKTRKYSITETKASGATATALPAEDVQRMVSHWAAPSRHKPRVLNGSTEVAKRGTCANANAAEGVLYDVLIRSPIVEAMDKQVTFENARPLLPLRELEVVFRRFPTVGVSPGALLEISDKGGHSEDLMAASEPFRVDALSVRGRALQDDPESTYGEGAAELDVEISVRLSMKSDRRVPLPATRGPHFPWHVEGKVVSEVGEKADITYDLAVDQATSLSQYRIQIPLFENQEIRVPYEPATGAGNLYLPLYKGQRVLVALDFQSARFERLLDWRPEAKVVKDGQGQHLFLGKSAKSHTSLLHEYEDEVPVLRMLRTNDKDTVLFRLEEGRMILKVEEQKG